MREGGERGDGEEQKRRGDKEEKRRGDKERGDGPTPRCKAASSKGDEEERKSGMPGTGL